MTINKAKKLAPQLALATQIMLANDVEKGEELNPAKVSVVRVSRNKSIIVFTFTLEHSVANICTTKLEQVVEKLLPNAIITDTRVFLASTKPHILLRAKELGNIGEYHFGFSLLIN